MEDDDDLMFSLREANFGAQLDDGSHLIQLYVDDISLTNPIGPRKDRHKMTMVYYLVEDIPAKFRSLVQSINLLAIAPSHSLKERGNFSSDSISHSSTIPNALQADGLTIK